MPSRGHHVLASVLALLVAAAFIEQADAHPGCANDFILSSDTNTKFCPTGDDVLYAEGICCDTDMEDDIIGKLISADTTGTCAAMYKEVRRTT